VTPINRNQSNLRRRLSNTSTLFFFATIARIRHRGSLMNDNATRIESFTDMAATTQILINYLSASDENKSHEAISVLLMQGLTQLWPGSVAMQQFFPVFDTIKRRIDASDIQGALRQQSSSRRNSMRSSRSYAPGSISRARPCRVAGVIYDCT
jgi:hypothetical protein